MNEKPLMDLAEKLAVAVEKSHGGCIPWPASQRRMVAITIRNVLVEEMCGSAWEETVKRLAHLEALNA